MKNFYYLLVKLDTKSRLLQKNVKELILFTTSLTEINFKNKKKILFLNSPLCSKSKELLFQEGWRIL